MSPCCHVGAGLIARKTIEGLEAGQGGGILGQLAEVLKGQKKMSKMMRSGANMSGNVSSDSDSQSDGCSSDTSDSDDDGSNSSSSSSNGGAESDDAAAAGVLSLPHFPARRYCWGKPAQLKFNRTTKIWTETKAAESVAKFRTLPVDFTLKSTPRLSSVFRKFMHQSGNKKRPIPALSTLNRPKFNIASDQVLNDFKKARTVTGLMLDVVKMTEDGRQLLHTYRNEPTYNSLTALADFAQAEYVKRAPPTKSNRKRGRAEEINFRTASGWTKKIRLGLQAEKEQQQQQPPSNATKKTGPGLQAEKEQQHPQQQPPSNFTLFNEV